MKSRFLPYISIFLIVFILVSAGYFFLVLQPQVRIAKADKKRRLAREQRHMDLVEGRLSYVSFNDLATAEKGFYQNMGNKQKMLESFLTKSEYFFKTDESHLLDKALLIRDREVTERIEEQYLQLSELTAKLDKILAYTPMDELYPLVAKENYDSMLGTFRATREGLSPYKNYSYLQPMLENVLNDLVSLENSYEREDYTNSDELIASYLDDYQKLKEAAYSEVRGVLHSQDSLQLLADWSNLINDYKN
jgi:hypothetical protein